MFTSKAVRVIGAVAIAGLTLSGISACSSGGTGAESGSDGEGSGAETPIEFEWGVPTSAYVALYVAEDQGYFEDEGLAPNFQTFQSGAPLLAGLQSDSLDIATSGLASVFALGQGIDIRIFGFEGGTDITEGLVARAGGSIQSIDDLANGAPVGVATGTCAQISALFAAKKAGLEYSDINVVDLAPNLFANSFESGSVDAGFSWSPYILDLQRDSGATIIGWDTDWVPGGASCPQTHYGRSEFLDEHPDAAVKIVRALERAWADLREDPQIGVTALLDRMGGSEETALEVVERTIESQPTLEDLATAGSAHSFVGTEGIVRQFDQAADAFVDLGVIAEPLSAETLKNAVDPTALEAVFAGE
ncbi:ABC transporter substrate-binding protein [Leucobacter sp. CSA1]|uniref:ABC transporter substrate-binding protein n=2 Tax=Leucobacter chromiisoli TaxID=2796471 RepID=A0A934Q8I2_9MICO|nr:ABC transporter substrate-binding protein [Leucobacter chromiisoli]